MPFLLTSSTTRLHSTAVILQPKYLLKHLCTEAGTVCGTLVRVSQRRLWCMCAAQEAQVAEQWQLPRGWQAAVRWRVRVAFLPGFTAAFMLKL